MAAEPMAQLNAIAAGGKAAGDAYKSMASQMSSDRAAALSQALGRTAGIQGPAAPAAFNSYAAPRITGAFDRSIAKENALGSANNAFEGALNSAANTRVSGIEGLANLIVQAIGAKYSPDTAAGQAAMSKALTSALEPLRVQSELGGYLSNIQNNTTKQAKQSATNFFAAPQDYANPQMNTQHALGQHIVNTQTGLSGALKELQDLRTAITLGPTGSFKTSAGKTVSNKGSYNNALQTIGTLGLAPQDIQNLDQNQMISLLRQYYGQPDVGVGFEQ